MTKPRKDGEAANESTKGPDAAARPEESGDEGQAEALAALDEMVDEMVDEDQTDAAAQDPDPEESAADESVEPGPEEVLRRERDHFQEKWLRVAAELENVRKRSRRELIESRRFAQADALRPFLEVLDNFERALQTPPGQTDNQENNGFREGVELIFQKFQGLLKDLGVQPIEALDQPFDPNVHEAVGQLEREGTVSGQVIEVVQQGYRFQDLVIRPARVIIAG